VGAVKYGKLSCQACYGGKLERFENRNNARAIE
jgi:hypothetical protein